MAKFKGEADSVYCESELSGRKVIVELDGAVENDLLNAVTAADAVSYFSIMELLDEMDVDDVKDHLELFDEDQVQERIEEALLNAEGGAS